MTKKHLILLADYIRQANNFPGKDGMFTPAHLDRLAAFCYAVNPRFDRERWLGYIAGTNGPSGGRR